MLEEMMPRWVPTENVNGFEICPGLYRDEGATAFQSAVNFTVHSKGAVTCELLLFHRKEPEPYAVIPFPENCRIGDVFSMMVFGLDIEEFEYAYRLDGPWKPKEGLLFDKKHILLDPYAKAVTGQSVWGKALNTGGYRARVVRNNFCLLYTSVRAVCQSVDGIHLRWKHRTLPRSENTKGTHIHSD